LFEWAQPAHRVSAARLGYRELAAHDEDAHEAFAGKICSICLAEDIITESGYGSLWGLAR
jgi:hypothetical protein